MLPPGLTASMWEEIKSYFQAEAPKLLLEPRPIEKAIPSRSTGARSGSKKKV